ncbi:MAG TPA: hypothetical protein VGQ53_11745 [Chitinophagaceae bacterium]|jgi:hypothetical protein|nr:hypothetical protein [Chitinophagaceae bacterium]
MPNQVSTIVYKYNSKGFVLIGIYILGLIVAFYHSLSMSMWEILFFGAIFLAVPLYVQYGNNNKVRMLVPDERSLIFSGQGIQFGLDHYPVKDIEAAAVFLEAFTGFEYRLFGAAGRSRENIRQVSNGDQNKISFRFKGEIVDFTFCLTSYAQFCMFRAVINDWLAAGVNVVLKQAFNDEFIIGEITYYDNQNVYDQTIT